MTVVYKNGKVEVSGLSGSFADTIISEDTLRIVNDAKLKSVYERLTVIMASTSAQLNITDIELNVVLTTGSVSSVDILSSSIRGSVTRLLDDVLVNIRASQVLVLPTVVSALSKLLVDCAEVVA